MHRCISNGSFGLLVASLLAVAMSTGITDANAEARWFQVPGHAVWVDVPSPWRVKGDPRAPMLHLAGDESRRIEVLVMEGLPVKTALARRKTAMEAQYTAVTWSAPQKSTLSARMMFDATELHAQIFAVQGEGHTLVVTSYAREQGVKAVRKVQQAMVASRKAGWKRPGGLWASIPHVAIRVNVPEGWNTTAKDDSVRLYLRRDTGAGALELGLDARAEVDIQKSLAYIIEGAGGDAVTWARAKKWKPTWASKGKVVGLTRHGKARVDGKAFRFVVYAWPVAEGHLLVAARTSGPESKTVLKEIEAIALSLK
ncbi:MAG: hypothetical protein ACI9WU_002202 [Myxococcota bacterium]|jgi:hypothetical protein